MSFFQIFFTVYGTCHAYLAFRLARLPWIQEHSLGKWVVLAMVLMGAAFPLGRYLDRPGFDRYTYILETVGTYWMGTFFILLWVTLLVDIVTLGGLLFRPYPPLIRTYAACGGLVLAAFAIVQGNRAPVVTEYDVALKGLPRELENFRLVVVSDLHLGTRIGSKWVEKTFKQIDGLKGDAVVIAGDLIDNNAEVVAPMVDALMKLKAPKGVFTVVGNHEYYAGDIDSVAIMDAAGYRTLRNEHVEIAPGLILAGINDLSVMRAGGDRLRAIFDAALRDRPAGATVLVTHSPTPSGLKLASERGVGLSLSGHTHNGQIWPFKYLVATRFEFLNGLYPLGDMQAMVTRGAGTWGPRMRLWAPGEIVLIRLHPAG